jgi:hypothetical protein
LRDLRCRERKLVATANDQNPKILEYFQPY